MLHRTLRIAIALVLLAVSAARAQPASDSEAKPYVVGAGDKLEILIHTGAGEPIKLEPYVSGDGSIDVMHLGRVTVEGLTPTAIRDKIRGGLVARDIFKDPHVSVNITEYHSQGVNVSGFVSKPGRIYLHGPTHLMDVISECEGIKEEEAGTTVQVMRVGSDRPIVIQRRDLFSSNPDVARAANIYVQKDDHVHVPKKAMFCVLGPVNKPGCYPLQDDMTLLQVFSVAEGLVDDSDEGAAKADRANVVIRRGSQEIKIDLDAPELLANLPRIEADDQIVVGTADRTRFCVRGPVEKPDCYEASGKITLDEAIAKAGGLDQESTDRGHIPDPENITVRRRLKDGSTKDYVLSLEVPGAEGARFPILNDDTIVVGETQCLVSVQGEVGTPGQYAVTPNMSIEDAIAAAGGAMSARGFVGALGKTKLRRGDSFQEIDVKAIMNGKAPDVLVQCGDKITVPPKKI